MKPRVVEVDVKGQRKERVMGDAPMIGKVAKVGDMVEAAEMDAKRSGQLKKRRHSVSPPVEPPDRVETVVQMLLLAAVGLGVLLLLVLVAFRLKKVWDGEIAEVAGYQVSQSVPVDSVVEPLPLAEIEAAAAVDLVRRGLATRNAARVHDYFRLTDATEPGEVVAFLELMASRDGVLSGLEPLPPLATGGRLLGRVMVNTGGGDGARQRVAMLTQDHRGEWKIDYPAFAQSANPSWQTLLDGGHVQGVIRVEVTPGGPLPSGAEAGTWSVWCLEARDAGCEMFGYCVADSPQARAMNALRRSDINHGGRRVTLQVRPMEGMGRGHFLVERVLAEDWVLLEQGFDEQFVEPSGP